MSFLLPDADFTYTEYFLFLAEETNGLYIGFITDKYFYVGRVESLIILNLILLNGFLYASGRNVVYKFTAPRRKPVIGANAVSPSTGTLSNVSAILAHFPSLPHLALLSRRRRRW